MYIYFTLVNDVSVVNVSMPKDYGNALRRGLNSKGVNVWSMIQSCGFMSILIKKLEHWYTQYILSVNQCRNKALLTSNFMLRENGLCVEYMDKGQI